MYAACKQMFDTASVKVRQGDPLVGRVLLTRLSNCAETSRDCPYCAECRNMSCVLNEVTHAA